MQQGALTCQCVIGNREVRGFCLSFAEDNKVVVADDICCVMLEYHYGSFLLIANINNQY